MDISYKKNDIIDLSLIDLTTEGLGLSKKGGQVFFVKDAIIGDKVSAVITKVTRSIIYAKSIKIIEKSVYRVLSKCKVSEACGGCQLLNLDYKKQLEIKQNNVLNCIKKIGKIDVSNIYEGIIHCEKPCHFRNKMQVPYAKKDDEIVYGFYAGRTHYIVPFEYCIVGFKNADVILNAVKKSLIKFNISIYDEINGEGIFREVFLRCGNKTQEISITYIINDKKYEKNIDLYKRFDDEVRNIANDFSIVSSYININTDNNNVLLGKKNILLYGKAYIEDKIGDIKYRISPESFYQVNNEMTKILYDKIIEYADFTGNENVLDLYCGIGTISLYIAKYVNKVYGVELVEKAIEDAKCNAKINDIHNAQFKCFDLSKDLDINDRYDMVIVDPPRKGLDENTINLLTSIMSNKIIYVSCDPATLSRDLNILCNDNANYKIKKICNVDMFPHTMHIETIALLER